MLPIKNLCRQMPENIVHEELETLNIRVQGDMQFRSSCREQDPNKDLRPTSQFIVSVAQDHEVSSVLSPTKLCGLQVTVESYIVPKDPLQGKRCQRFGNTQRK